MSIRTARDGQPTGVWELQDLQAAVDRGEVLPTDLVWSSGFPSWAALSDVAREIGISLPTEQERVPPIPSSHEIGAPPIPMAPVNAKLRSNASDPSGLGELKFRKRTDRQAYGFSAGSKAVFLLLLIGGGWAFVNYGWPWISQRWRSNQQPSAVVNDSTDAPQPVTRSSASVEANQSRLEEFVRGLEGRVVKLYRASGEEYEMGIYVKDGWPHHCLRNNDAEACRALLDLDATMQINDSEHSAGSKNGESCRLTKRTSRGDRDKQVEVTAICVSEKALAGGKHPPGVPYAVVGIQTNGEEPVVGAAFFSAAVVNRVAPSSDGTHHEGSDLVSSEESARPECIEISRRWAEARRKVDALEGTPAGGFATIELARIENVERVFAGCKGSESREEQEYLQQHPGHRNVQQHPGYRNGIRSAGNRCPMPEADNAEPKACVTRPPMYPREEQRRGIQGTAVVIAHLDEQGAVRDVELEVSSGNRNLDREALKAVSGYSFSPLIEDGQPKSTRLRMPMTFSLVNAPNNDVQVADSNEVGTEPNQEPSTDDTAESQ